MNKYSSPAFQWGVQPRDYRQRRMLIVHDPGGVRSRLGVDMGYAHYGTALGIIPRYQPNALAS